MGQGLVASRACSSRLRWISPSIDPWPRRFRGCPDFWGRGFPMSGLAEELRLKQPKISWTRC